MRLFLIILTAFLRPLDSILTAPLVHRGVRCSTVALDHRTGRIYPIKNVLLRVNGNPNRAYLIKKSLSKSVYGVIRLCVVLKRRTGQKNNDDKHRRGRRNYGVIRDEDAEWESTEELAVVKVRSFILLRESWETAKFGRDDATGTQVDQPATYANLMSIIYIETT